jgi:hypothetical protein
MIVLACPDFAMIMSGSSPVLATEISDMSPSTLRARRAGDEAVFSL